LKSSKDQLVRKIPFWIRLSLNTLILLFLTFVFQSLEWEIGQERQLLQALRRVKIGLNLQQRSLDQKVLFLNTSYAKQLIPKYDETGFIEIGAEPITDRETLVEFTGLLKDTNFDLVIMDILFDVKTDHDSELQSNMDSLTNVLVVNHLDAQKKPLKLMLDVDYGLADLITLGGYFHKYRFEEHGEKSVALKAFRQLNKKEYKNGWLLGRLGDKYIYNTIVLNNRITQRDLLAKKYPLVELNEFLELNQENIKELVEDRIVVVGDFFNDTVDSIDGKIAGSLVLLNAYLALKNGDADVSFSYVLFLCLVYAIISYITLRSAIIENWKFFKWLAKYVKPLKPIFIMSMFFLTTCLSYFIFHKLVSVFFLTVYLSIVSYLNKKFLIIPDTEIISNE